ncbi:MAG: hypothetical protein QXZ49_04155, partial [Nitrososphaerota archaeon]
MPKRGVEEAAQRVVTYREQRRLIAYTADIGLRLGKGKVGEAVDRILLITNAYGGYLVSVSVSERDA